MEAFALCLRPRFRMDGEVSELLTVKNEAFKIRDLVRKFYVVS